MLKKVKIKNIRENDNPNFVKTVAVDYSREGKEKIWEMIKSHDSVHVLVNNIETKKILLVKQVRIPVLVNNKNNGVCIEACAGIVDKDIPINEIAQEEILEELGYDVPIDNIKKVSSYKSSVGTAGTNCHTFYTEVNEKMKVGEGGGLEDEDIEIVRMKYSEVENFVFSENNTDSTTLFLLMNFLYKYKNRNVNYGN